MDSFLTASGKNHFGGTPPSTLSTPLPAIQRSHAQNHTCFAVNHVINGNSSNTNRELNHQLPHDFAGKGVLNVLGGVPPKRFLPI